MATIFPEMYIYEYDLLIDYTVHKVAGENIRRITEAWWAFLAVFRDLNIDAIHFYNLSSMSVRYAS